MFLGNLDHVFEPQGTDFAAEAEACGAQTCRGDYGHEPEATRATVGGAAQERCLRACAWTG
jgi:hypothetical protein